MAQDYERLSERDLSGTARYVAMSGAMTAVGGDASAVRDNPAGLGVYRRMELTLTGDVRTDDTHTSYWSVPEAAWVINAGQHNFMISTHRIQSYHRVLSMQGGEDASLGALIAETYQGDLGMDYPQDARHSSSVMRMGERGYVQEYAADWAVNVRDKFYWGLGVRMQSYELVSDVDYEERFASGDKLTNTNMVQMSGIGCNVALGVLWRPAQWLRLGLGYVTPSINSINEYTSGCFQSQVGAETAESRANDITYEIRDYYAPQHLSLGAALQWTTWGVLSAQYDYTHARYVRDRHSWRIGGELIPVPGLYLNAGYGYEWDGAQDYAPIAMDYSLDRQDAHSVHHMASQYASCGIGWRGKNTIAQLAYQYRWQVMDIYAHEMAQPYSGVVNNHRIVLTLGWHN